LDNQFSTKSAIILDNGLFAELAIKLAESFGHVQYYAPSMHDPFPKSKEGLIGDGYDNVERVLDWESRIGENDIFICPDINWAPTQSLLRSMGKRVFGCGYGDEMENYRDEFREHMKTLGLPVIPYKTLVGLPALREHLKTVKDKYVKINLWRGDGESLKSADYRIVESRLDRWEWELGESKYYKKFIIEELLAGREEVGGDLWSADGQYPKSYLAGIEKKGVGYIGVFRQASEFPKELTRFTDAIADTLKNYQYRGFISYETLLGEDRVDYMMDLCTRLPSPPGDAYIEFYKNLPDIIWNCAEGKIIEPVVEHKYIIQIMIYSDWVEDNWACLEFPEKYRKNIKMRYACKTKNGYFTIPTKGNSRLCAIVAEDNTIDAAANQIEEVCEQIKIFKLDISTESIEQIKTSFKKLVEWGMPIVEESELQTKQKEE